MTDLLFPPLSRPLVAKALAELQVPTDFVLGTSTAGYQVEGGFNGDGEPANNWWEAERSGRVPRTGLCCDFWNRYPEDFDLCQNMKLNGVRIGVEWARLEPRCDRRGGRVQLDEHAVAGYARMIAAAWQRGLRPCVTLHHFTHPWHAGQGLWLVPQRALELFLTYAQAAVEAINERLVGEHGVPPIPYFTTVNEPFMLASATHLLHMFPGPRASWGMGFVRQVLETLHLLHVGLYRHLHALYAEHGWARPIVTLNPYATALYESDLMLLQILTAPARGIERSRLETHLLDEKRYFEDTVNSTLVGRRSQPWIRERLEGIGRRLAARHLAPEHFEQLIDAVYAGPEGERLLDAVALDFYDPYFGDYIDFGSLKLVRVRHEPWTWRQVPVALPAFLELYARAAPAGVGVDLLEQGMCYRCGVGGLPEARPEGYQRGRLLRAGILGCLIARAGGVPVNSYYHWSLIDNYEWGSFEPRFGIHAVRFSEGRRRLPTDVMGEDVAAVYRAVAQAMQAGDREALIDALADPSA